MRQTFLVELEWLAGDTPYSEGDLLEQLRTVFGREYDNEIYSVKEVLPKVEPLEIKIKAQTVVANEGGFEPHPESYTPRVFAAIIPHWPIAGKDELNPPDVYEILQNGHAIPWPCLPILEGFDYWVLYVEHLSDIDMHRAPKPKPRYPHSVELSGGAACFDPVPQADGYSEEGAPWKEVEVQGKKFPRITSEELYRIIKEYGKPYMSSGGNFIPYVSPLYQVGNEYYYLYDDLHPEPVKDQESGPLSHLPEGGH